MKKETPEAGHWTVHPFPFIPRRPLVFDGYPYLLVEILGPMRHLTALPSGRPRADLFWLASAQTERNRFASILALSESSAVRFEPSGRVELSPIPPYAGLAICDRLQTAAEFASDPELVSRQGALRKFVEQNRGRGYFVGNKRWLGRNAAEDELTFFRGKQAGGVPNGLRRCPSCGEWRGRCLDPNPAYADLIMPVHCRCENDTRCARCGRPFGERKLNALHYRPEDGQLWFSPGFMAFTHRCAERPQ